MCNYLLSSAKKVFKEHFKEIEMKEQDRTLTKESIDKISRFVIEKIKSDIKEKLEKEKEIKKYYSYCSKFPFNEIYNLKDQKDLTYIFRKNKNFCLDYLYYMLRKMKLKDVEIYCDIGYNDINKTRDILIETHFKINPNE